MKNSQFILSLLPKKINVLIKKIYLGYKLVFLKSSYLVQTGYVNSVTERTIENTDGRQIPWMNYPFIDFLEEKLNKNLTVFEYGSGFSTIFFAKRTKEIISIEYNKEWYEKVNNMFLKKVDNATVHYTELNESYPKAIEKLIKGKKCDVIIIDGRMRVECSLIAYNYLSDRGVLIFDDSQRLRYKEGIEFYKEKGFKTITFTGLKPTGIGVDHTTLLYRSNNCLGI